MSKTVRQKAIHQIRLGARKDKRGEVETIEPGEEFNCPEEELTFLQNAGACVDPDRNVTRATSTTAAVQTDSAEEERQVLLGQAKELGIKGIRKDMTATKIQEKIDEWRAENGDPGPDENEYGGGVL